jgi:hypothetical protein
MNIKVGDLLILNNKTDENITDLNQDPYIPDDGSFFIVSEELADEFFILFDTQSQIYSRWSSTSLLESIKDDFFSYA